MRRIKGIPHYSGPEIEGQVKLVMVDVLMELQGLIMKKTLEHPKLLHLKCLKVNGLKVDQAKES